MYAFFDQKYTFCSLGGIFGIFVKKEKLTLRIQILHLKWHYFAPQIVDTDFSTNKILRYLFLHLMYAFGDFDFDFYMWRSKNCIWYIHFVIKINLYPKHLCIQKLNLMVQNVHSLTANFTSANLTFGWLCNMHSKFLFLNSMVQLWAL